MKIRRERLTPPYVLIDKSQNSSRGYEVQAIPSTYVIDAKGKLVLGILGQTNFMEPHGPIRKTVDSLLAK